MVDQRDISDGWVHQPTLEQIREAQTVLRQYFPPTPLVFNAWLSETFQCEVYLKLENMQPIGSFKIRGATYKISKLTEDQKKQGVIAASAGNHAQGVAWGSKRLGVRSLIVMPATAPLVKVQNTQALGAEILLHGHSYDQAFEKAQEIARETGRVFIHAFEDADVITGQGTAGLEIFDQLPDVDWVVGSVGGGGLVAGVSTVLKSLRSQVKMAACQAKGAPSMIRSIEQGRAASLSRVDTFADGIAVARASESLRRILAPLVDQWVEIDDDEIAAAVLNLIEKAKTIAEGSGAAALGGLWKLKSQIQGKKVVVIVSGGNIDVNVLARIIDVGLIRAGRRVRVNIVISDRPGSLAKVTQLIADQGANILQAIHDRNEPSNRLNETEVALTLETRGPSYSRALVEELRRIVIRLELTH
jgi:threonine dehydratase